MRRLFIGCLCAAFLSAACDESPSRDPDDDAGPSTPQCSELGGPCTTWDDCCGSGVYCGEGKCATRQELGTACTTNEQCRSNVCDYNNECCLDLMGSPDTDCSTDGDCCFGAKCQSGECCSRAGQGSLACLGGNDPTCCSGRCDDISGNCL